VKKILVWLRGHRLGSGGAGDGDDSEAVSSLHSNVQITSHLPCTRCLARNGDPFLIVRHIRD
jgi:hypothetical protein